MSSAVTKGSPHIVICGMSLCAMSEPSSMRRHEGSDTSPRRKSVVPVPRSESCASDTVHRSFAWAETGLIVVLEGLVGELLCLVKLEAPFALRAGGLVVLAPVRRKPVRPSADSVPMCTVGGCFRNAGKVYHLRHRVDHPKFLSESLQVNVRRSP